MSRTEPASAIPTYCNAILQDARLVEEALKVDTNALEKLSQGNQPGVTQVSARTEIANEANVLFEGDTAVQLQVKCNVRVAVLTTVTGTVPVVTYSSEYVAIFRISESSGFLPEGSPVISALAPYFAQGNWLAVRRADGSIAATGIASLRLRAPEVGPTLPPNTPVPDPVAAH